MKAGLTALTDTQRVVLESGKALAEELGLHPFVRPTEEIQIAESDKARLESFGLTESSYTVPTSDIGFEDGQTVLIATPHGTKVGTIEVQVLDYANTRNTAYLLNGEVLFKRNQRFKDGEWVDVFSPDLNIPINAVLYVS